MDISKLKKGFTFMLPFLPDIWGFFRDKAHDKSIESMKQTLKDVAENPDFKKWIVDETTYEDEITYAEALIELDPDKRNKVRGYMRELRTKRGKKIRSNIIWAVSCHSEKQSRINRLNEFASCETYQEFDDMLVADGMLTPTDDTSGESADAFMEKWNEIVNFFGKKRKEIEKDLSFENTGPFSGFRNKMKEKYLNNQKQKNL